jgi:hypothetical protein
MRKHLLSLLVPVFLLLTFSIAFAGIDIYCPKCKNHVYIYSKDEIKKGEQVKAEDFVPAQIIIAVPESGEPMVCPFDGVPLNGWEYYAKIQHYKDFVLAYPAVSMLTKDKEGKWLWVPFDIPMLNFNEGKNE